MIKEKKPSKRKYIITAFVIFLCIFSGLTYRTMTWEPKPDPESERVIREAAATWLSGEMNINKNPDDLTDKDFERLKKFSPRKWTNTLLFDAKLCDIRLLDKFTNLQELQLDMIIYPENKIPKWMKYLAKFGIIDLDKKFAIDLSPIQNLYALKTLRLSQSQISDITPLKDLINLEQLYIENTLVSDLEPLRGLKNLQVLSINGTKVSDLEPIKGLTNLKSLSFSGTKVSNLESVEGLAKLQELIVASTEVTDLEPLRNLMSLRALYINVTQVSDIEPIMGLNNLEKLGIGGCENISKEQKEDLKKAMPNLKFSLNM